MRIAILTLPLHANYGGILQAYALQTVLECMGHEVVVLSKDYIPVRVYSGGRKMVRTAKRSIERYILRRPVEIYREERIIRELPIMRQFTNRFIQSYINTYPVQSLSAISSNDFDAIVVGSDQIWRPKYIKQLWKEDAPMAFLAFAKDWQIKRVAYAASFGVDEWEFSESETPELQKLISRFSAISVREKSGISLCKKYLHVQTEQVLDPTLLLSRQDYEALIAKQPKSNGDLLVYLLDETLEKTQLLKRIACERRLTPFSVKARNWSEASPLEERIQPPVEKWLAGFRDAKFVVTDSFHACVFSILFGKPFVAIGNVQRGMSRFESLLGDMGLIRNLISSSQEYDAANSYEIPAITYQIIENERQKSMTFLNKLNSND